MTVIAWLVIWRCGLTEHRRRVRAASEQEAWDTVDGYSTSAALGFPAFELCTIRPDDRTVCRGGRRRKKPPDLLLTGPPPPVRVVPKLKPPSRAARRGME